MSAGVAKANERGQGLSANENGALQRRSSERYQQDDAAAAVMVADPAAAQMGLEELPGRPGEAASGTGPGR